MPILIKRTHKDFRGVDFLNNEVISLRSSDSKNVWYNYGINGKRLETRPGMTLLGAFPNGIFGLFFYTYNQTTKTIVHNGTKLYTWDNYPLYPVVSTEIYTGMNPTFSNAFVFNQILFIKDGINYLEYNGVEVKEVVGTIPTTSIGRTPFGETITDSNDLVYQDVNLLQPKRRNAFVADGDSKEYYLDTKDLDAESIFVMEAKINGVIKIEGVDFTVDRINGIVTFNEAPSKPLQDGENNVIITLSKTISGYADRIKKCTVFEEFDNRMFFSGNQDYPNVVFHSELEDPRYIRDNARYPEGLDLAPVNTLIKGNDVIWAIKESNQNKTTIFYHIPTIDSTYGKIYPSYQGNITTGSIGAGVNFGDDIAFFSTKGMEAIDGAINSEKLLSHRSSMVDSKLTNTINYKKIKLSEYKGYLMCLVDSKIFLADSRQKFTNEATGEVEYEWYYWELPNNITYMKEYDDKLYYGNANGELYLADGTTDNGIDIDSDWTIPFDNFGTETQLKTTNKRGGVANVKVIENGKLKIYIKTDEDTDYTLIGEYSTDKGYIVYRIREKKFKKLSIKFSSNNFGLFSCNIEAFIGAFVKR